MLDYISRAKDLRSAILDAERRSRGSMDLRITAEIDALTARSFCDGLPLPYRLQIRPEYYSHPFDAFAAAKTLAKREELDKERHNERLKYENTPRRTANSTYHPLAHSTPRHTQSPPRRPPQTTARNNNIPPREVRSNQRQEYSRNETRFANNYRP